MKKIEKYIVKIALIIIIVLLLIVPKPKQYVKTIEEMENLIAKKLDFDQEVNIINTFNLNDSHVVGFTVSNNDDIKGMGLADFKEDKKGRFFLIKLYAPSKLVKRGQDIWVYYILDNFDKLQ